MTSLDHSLDKPSAILLVCIINYKKIQISFDYLYNLFSKYGVVKKILFFEKSLTWKAFIEMGDIPQASKARTFLNNTSLFNDGSKMNIYFSNLKYLILPKNMMNGKDYTKKSDHSFPDDQKYLTQLKSLSLQETSQQDKPAESSTLSASLNLDLKPKNPHLYLDSEKETLNSIKEESSLHSLNDEKSTDFLIECKSLENINSFSEPPGLDKSIKKHKNLMMMGGLGSMNQLQSIIGVGENKRGRRSIDEPLNWSDQIELINNNNNVNFTNFCGDASKVLFIKGLDEPGISVAMIYNVFSNFGNISKIIFMRNKGGALIEFHSVEYATIAKDFLNNLFFFSNYLKISYSNYQEIILKNCNFDALKEDIMICEEIQMRFKKYKNLLINPPSNVIHLSNLEKETCTEDQIRKFLAGIGHIEKMKFLFQEELKNMCLVRLSKLEDGLKAIALKHNEILGGRNVKISFTKTKI